MEVVDDMKLGKIIKQAGFRSGAGIAQDFVVSGGTRASAI